MFIEEEEWSDDQDAQVLSRAVLKTDQKNVKNSKNVKPKVVGKKSLMRTLQTLGSVPDWKSDERQQDSDSETEAAPSSGKKKKKRRKKRKHAGTTEQPENGELDQTPAEEKTLTNKKDKKFGNQKVKNNCVGKTEVKGKDKPVNATVNNPEDTEKLSRQQWKNKMKNKRNCKNKYRLDKKPEETVKKTKSAEEHKQHEEVKSDSQNNNNNNKSEKNSQTSAKQKEKEPKAVKRKKTEDAKMSCVTETQTHGEEKGDKAGKGTAGLKQIVDEPQEEFTEEPETPSKRPKVQLSKEQSLKRERMRKILNSKKSDHQESPAEQKEEPPIPEPQPQPEVKMDRSASLRSRMEQRLESARFRYINEVLYSTTSGEARRMFKQDPEAFGIYHRGYTAQVQRWPVNPVNAIIAFIKQKPSSLVVADFGCGDCKIARSVKNKVHSFDLAATCELVTVCDMANVPLPDRSVDIAVFCLSLMGTNLSDFLAEANRVLKMGGVLKIAEVASRFENVRNFSTALANLGFKLVTKDTENTHFYSFECVKTGAAPENIKKFGLQLMPCVYKKR
ncbi:uncharacterized protein rrp8 [Halichoeres trimaculatus]|uniref:uncharacterized protein rrp8 n=1 Tax=Halichoeres trimaculatus TaxID=147232 RepID=UPI003D9F1C81